MAGISGTSQEAGVSGVLTNGLAERITERPVCRNKAAKAARKARSSHHQPVRATERVALLPEPPLLGTHRQYGAADVARLDIIMSASTCGLQPRGGAEPACGGLRGGGVRAGDCCDLQCGAKAG